MTCGFIEQNNLQRLKARQRREERSRVFRSDRESESQSDTIVSEEERTSIEVSDQEREESDQEKEQLYQRRYAGL